MLYCTDLNKKKYRRLVQVKESETVTVGIQDMINHYGLGPLTPNTVIFGGLKKRIDSTDFIKVLGLAHTKHKNIVILNKSEKLGNFARNNIHIWWDNNSKSNSELMLVLGYMLQTERASKRSRLCIKAIVDNELDRKKKWKISNKFV